MACSVRQLSTRLLASLPGPLQHTYLHVYTNPAILCIQTSRRVFYSTLPGRYGGCPLTQVHTAGGGAASKVWNEIRQGMIGVPVITSKHTEAAYGAALLARHSLHQMGVQ